MRLREAGPEEGATWVGVNALGFGDGVPRFEDLYRAYLVAPSARRFLVYADGRPAGAALSPLPRWHLPC
ncbi:MAG: hypothetical protein KatS3mg060_3721 [Dehalococcoidia bacterium]|nr:MAG: hypothetical protein KatS3mg060_3721 [Dehalococcoidia bacterium]